MSEFKRRSIAALLKETPGQEVIVKGWVRTKRGNNNVNFIALNDGSTVNNMQIVCETANFEEELLRSVTTGSCLCVTGNLVKDRKSTRLNSSHQMISYAVF